MANVLELLVQYCKGNGAISVERHGSEVLTTLRLNNGRSQKVKIGVQPARVGQYHVARCTSRACVATEPSIVRRALKANANSDCGGYSLETALSPPALDFTYSLLIPHDGFFDMSTLWNAIVHVAVSADRVEMQTIGQDIF